MCEVFFSQNIWSVAGLSLDCIGVGLLGFDLIRLQTLLKKSAEENLNVIDKMSSDFGGIESWAEEIEGGARWIHAHEYWDDCADDPETYNTLRLIDKFKDLANCVSGNAQHLSRLTLLVDEQAKGALRTANNSVLISIAGLGLIAMGFLFQIIGSWPC